jgi:ubiquinone/menaquinone biosynthesis C-methylase UbiE
LNSFDIIHCASTYHYFRDRQIEFLRAVNRALKSNGTLVLEIELSDKGNNPTLERLSRGVDRTPCTFPNRPMFLEQINGLFSINAEFKSIFQEGSFFDLQYFHLTPIRADD